MNMRFTRAHLFTFYCLHFLTICLLVFCLGNIYFVKYPAKSTRVPQSASSYQELARTRRSLLEGPGYYELDNDVENDKKELYLTMRSKIEVIFPL